MLASPHPGEVGAAAQAAVRLLNTADTSWHELLATKEPQPQELLEAKVDALRDSNRQLRSENHHLRMQARRIGQPNNNRVRIFVAWMAFVFLTGLLVFGFDGCELAEQSGPNSQTRSRANLSHSLEQLAPDPNGVIGGPSATTARAPRDAHLPHQ
jgi:hypothetical protein